MHTGVWTDHDRNRHGDQSRAGQAATADTKAELARLEADGWLVLHDLQRPGRRFTTIDHIAVGPAGVVVIDTRRWTGQLDVVGGVLRQNGTRRDRECELAVASAASVTALLEPWQRTAVRSMIALVGQPTPARQPALTAVYGVGDLAAALRALPARLTTAETRAVADLLRRTLGSGSMPLQLTTAALATAVAESPQRAAHAPSGVRSRLARLRERTRIRPTSR